MVWHSDTTIRLQCHPAYTSIRIKYVELRRFSAALAYRTREESSRKRNLHIGDRDNAILHALFVP